MTPEDLKFENNRLRHALTRLEMAASDVIAGKMIPPTGSLAVEDARAALKQTIKHARKTLSGVTTDETK